MVIFIMRLWRFAITAPQLLHNNTSLFRIWKSLFFYKTRLLRFTKHAVLGFWLEKTRFGSLTWNQTHTNFPLKQVSPKNSL